MTSPTDQLLAELHRRGLTRNGVARALKHIDDEGTTLRDALVGQDLVTDVEFAVAQGTVYGLDAVDLGSYPVDDAALGAIPLALARRHEVVGIDFEDGTLVVAVCEPGNVLAIDDVRASTGRTIRVVVAARTDLMAKLDQQSREQSGLGGLASSSPAASSTVSETITADDDGPIVRFVNSLIDQAVQSRASDIHLEPGEHHVLIRFRIDGVLHEVDSAPSSAHASLISRLKIMSGLDITERRMPQSGRISARTGGRVVDLRTATLPTVWGEKMVLRVLDTAGVDLDLRALGFSERNLETFAAAFRKPHGMILATGPTGAGKSTTLYATLKEIARPEINVITVEDPVEYRMPGINQVQVNTKAGVTFSAVLPAILRADPDVVLIGEIRDRPTAITAVEAALTGHLVLSTLHTNDAPSAFTRLIEMGVEPFLVASSLECVIAQRLARRLCEWCKEAYEVDEEMLAGMRWPADVPVPEALFRAVGCRSCANTGYRGRLGLHEVMAVSDSVARLAARQGTTQDILEQARADGMQDLRSDGSLKAAAGLTTMDEVIRVAG